MRFLIISAAILACASASAILAPLAYAVNPGDLQAAAIDATVSAQDHARAAHEGHSAAVEQAAHANTEALRYAAETNRNIHENAVWSSVAAQQSAASALSGAAAAAEPHLAHAYAAPLAYGYAGLAAPYAGYGHAAYGHAAYGHAAYAAPLVHAW